MAEKDRVDITAVREVCVDGIPKYYIVPVYNDDTSEAPSYFLGWLGESMKVFLLILLIFSVVFFTGRKQGK